MAQLRRDEVRHRDGGSRAIRRGSRAIRRGTRCLAWLAALAVLWAGAAPAQDDYYEPRTSAAVTAASVFSSILYCPLKVAYAGGGLIIGGIAYGLSAGDADVFRAVATPAVYGDYLVTPAHLRGERKLEFLGRDPAYPSR